MRATKQFRLGCPLETVLTARLQFWKAQRPRLSGPGARLHLWGTEDYNSQGAPLQPHLAHDVASLLSLARLPPKLQIPEGPAAPLGSPASSLPPLFEAKPRPCCPLGKCTKQPAPSRPRGGNKAGEPAALDCRLLTAGRKRSLGREDFGDAPGSGRGERAGLQASPGEEVDGAQAAEAGETKCRPGAGSGLGKGESKWRK